MAPAQFTSSHARKATSTSEGSMALNSVFNHGLIGPALGVRYWFGYEKMADPSFLALLQRAIG
jgi:hypothetical protein